MLREFVTEGLESVRLWTCRCMYTGIRLTEPMPMFRLMFSAALIFGAFLFEGTLLSAEPSPPSAEQVAEWASFSKPVHIKAEKVDRGDATKLGTVVWVYRYAAKDETLSSYTIGLYKAGSLFGKNRAELEKAIGEQVEAAKKLAKERRGGCSGGMPRDIGIETRPDGRNAYFSVAGFGPGGYAVAAFTTVGEYDLLLEQAVDSEDDMPQDQKLKKPSQPSSRLSKIFKKLETHVFPGVAVSEAEDADIANEEGDAVLEEVASKIQKGSPDVVPLLRRWLAEESDRVPVDESPERLVLALRGLGAYRDTSSAELVSFFYKNATVGSALRPMAASTLVSIGAKESRPDLKAIVWDKRLQLDIRCRAAATLVELDDDLGREFLLLQYDLYRLECKTMHGLQMGSVRDTLEQISDEKLASAIRKRIAGEPNVVMQNNISTLLATMAINAESLERLETIATDTSWIDGHDRRYAAIDALGRKAGPDCIPLLESLRPWEGIDPNPDNIQQRFVKEHASKAILAIRQRHWKYGQTAEPLTGGNAEDGLP